VGTAEGVWDGLLEYDGTGVGTLARYVGLSVGFDVG